MNTVICKKAVWVLLLVGIPALAAANPEPLKELNQYIESALAKADLLEAAVSDGHTKLARDLIREIKGELRKAHQAAREVSTESSRAAAPTELTLTCPAKVKEAACSVEISGLVRKSGRQYFLVVNPALSADRAWVQAGEILAASTSRVVYLGMANALPKPERFTVALISAPAGTIKTDGEMKVADFLQLDVRIEASCIVERTR